MVSHLHAMRVIHRDLKLGNLFLTPVGLLGAPKTRTRLTRRGFERLLPGFFKTQLVFLKNVEMLKSRTVSNVPSTRFEENKKITSWSLRFGWFRRSRLRARHRSRAGSGRRRRATENRRLRVGVSTGVRGRAQDDHLRHPQLHRPRGSRGF